MDELSLDPIAPIYKRLREMGYEQDPQQKECVNIEGVPVQSRVLSAEHLAAICVQTGRMKDKLRVEMFLRSDKFDKARFFTILDSCKLSEGFSKWNLI